MASVTAPIPAARKAAAAQQATLADLATRAGSLAHDGLPEMVRRMVSALLDLTGTGLDAREAMRRVRSGNLLKDNSYAFCHLAERAIDKALRTALASLQPAPQSTAPQELRLVPFDEIDQQLALGAVSRPFDLEFADRLATLGVRLGLLLGRDPVRAAHNPFRPEVFLGALHAAWCEFEPDPEAHGLLAPLLRPSVMFDLGLLYDALVNMLQPARARQEAEARFNKRDDRAARKAERARRDAALSSQLRRLFDGGAPGDGLDIPMIPNLPQGSGGWRPSAASGFAVAALPTQTDMVDPPSSAAPISGAHAFAPADQTLLDLLARLGTSPAVMPDPGQAGTPHAVFYLPRASLPRADKTTLDLLSRVFETVLLDDAIPAETRDLIAFLQVPVLRAALRDRSFFYEEAHPARRMLDLLSQADWERDDPAWRAMRHSVERVRDQDQPEFDAALAELEAGIAARERAEQAAIAEPAARATRLEKQAAAERSARRAVALRMVGEDMAPLVSHFLEQRWTQVVGLAYAVEDSRPGAVDNATRTMDDLIWSVRPKATQEARQALIKRLPALLAALNKWLDAIRWQDAQRLEFFAALAECHAAIVRAPIELSPERQLELALEAAQQDALRRAAQEQAQADEPAAEDDGLAGLERGQRFEFHEDGAVRKLRLAWVSPLRTLFIFSGAGRQEAFSLPAGRLSALIANGAMRALAADGLVRRVLDAAVVAA
ncbi:DUF1631 family protein [Massilia sp. YIM B02443]|uniref:DUF1631 family protein n=1 Tax=Massilia sp. YIM B02443 TaxID=3050127 RepID=UPI0025B6FCE6|nr:DUF1631 family protein [Massilia sp. YIM B02443]MDN4039180.1 DUF1631 family protein [Massilia sp. YIM B02443]